MPYYETVFIARQELTDAQVKELTGGFDKIVKDGGGKVLKTEQWGLRTLAYRIGKNRKGHYVLIESDVPSETLLEMERQMRLSEDVLRYISVKLAAPSKGASAIMNKDTRDNDDRDRKDRKDRKDSKEAA